MTNGDAGLCRQKGQAAAMRELAAGASRVIAGRRPFPVAILAQQDQTVGRTDPVFTECAVVLAG